MEYILTPEEALLPRINGAKVIGVRPGRPVLHRIPVTGEAPVSIRMDKAVEGLSIDSSTGIITGTVSAEGQYSVEITAVNIHGEDRKRFTVIAGKNIALTPPMGWNSWNCWGKNINEEKVREAAEYMVKSGLAKHGWSYINIDDGWQGERDRTTGSLLPNEKFKDMKALCDYIHSLGLKVGIYSTPWKVSYAGFSGGSSDSPDRTLAEENGDKFGKYSFHQQDVKQWCEWGIDYLKYDWYPIDADNTRVMSRELRNSGRDIILSLSNSAPYEMAEEWRDLSECWRTTGDIIDTWDVTEHEWEHSVREIGFSQEKWAAYAGPGHWNDADMLAVGVLGWGGELRETRLTADEQYLHISLWALLASPLLIGCDLSRLDAFTRNLLTNDEILEVNQDALGCQARKIHAKGPVEYWMKPLEDGSCALGIFNLDERDSGAINVRLEELKLKGRYKVRDLWRQKDIGAFEKTFSVSIAKHGVIMLKLTKND